MTVPINGAGLEATATPFKTLYHERKKDSSVVIQDINNVYEQNNYTNQLTKVENLVGDIRFTPQREIQDLIQDVIQETKGQKENIQKLL